MDKSQRKYLEYYAEPEYQLALRLFENKNIGFEHVLCIPAFDEDFTELQALLETQFDSKSCLVILVLNTPLCTNEKRKLAEAHIGSLEAAIQRTLQLKHSIDNAYPAIAEIEHLSFHTLNQHGLLLINRTGESGIDYPHGVGLARKIANDCACALILKAHIKNALLFNTDADAKLPETYFQGIENSNKETAAWIFAFEHEGDTNNSDAKRYQQSMEHYVAGLKMANSPFAYHSIGSCLVINPQHYLQVRGFPKRNAGEDFYLLNKLRKIGRIESLNTSNIQLSCRTSHRVPFGTGRNVHAMNENRDSQVNKLFYHSACFEYLKYFLLFWQKAFDADVEPESALLRFINEQLPESLEAEIFQTLVNEENRQLKLASLLEASTSQAAWQHRFMQNFDALRTLKFIHQIRDKYYPKSDFPLFEST